MRGGVDGVEAEVAILRDFPEQPLRLGEVVAEGGAGGVVVVVVIIIGGDGGVEARAEGEDVG